MISWLYFKLCHLSCVEFLYPEGGSPNATAVILVLLLLLVVISSLKMPEAFLIRSTPQRNFAHTFVLVFPTDLPSQIFQVISS